jgi:Flp pilus assembly protein TadG
MLVLGFALIVVAVAGLAVDGTRAFLFRRSLQNAADSSALAGAGELDASSFYASGGRATVLAPAQARAVALSWLAKRGLPASAAVAADPTGVRVVLRGRVSTSFLAVVGLSAIPVAAEARAEPVG